MHSILMRLSTCTNVTRIFFFVNDNKINDNVNDKIDEANEVDEANNIDEVDDAD